MSVTACSGGAFSDRPSTLSYAADNKTPVETEAELLASYHSSDAVDRDNLSRQEYRDAVIWREVGADDDQFNQFVQRLRGQRAGLNIASDGAVIALNGVSTVTGTAATKAVLAAISGGIVGLRGSVDKELFNLEALSALMARMKAARLEALAKITAGMKQPIGDYPLEQALVDLRAYAAAGTLVSTLQAVHQDAGVAAAAATRAIEQNMVTRTTAYRDSLTDRDTIADRIGKLSDAKLVSMAFLMERFRLERSATVQQDLQAQNPSGSRFRSAAAARAFLIYWIDQEEGDPDQLKEWHDTLDLVEKG